MGDRNRYDPDGIEPVHPVVRTLVWSLGAVLSWGLIILLAWWIR